MAIVVLRESALATSGDSRRLWYPGTDVRDEVLGEGLLEVMMEVMATWCI